MSEFKSEICDGMRIDWDVPIEMDDGLVLRADAFRPIEESKYPVIITYGPYAKWGHFQDSYPYQWKSLTEQPGDLLADPFLQLGIKTSRHVETSDSEGLLLEIAALYAGLLRVTSRWYWVCRAA